MRKHWCFMILCDIVMMRSHMPRTRELRCGALLALALWFLGLPEQALTRIREGVSLARESSEPQSLAQAFVLCSDCSSATSRRAEAQENAEAAITVCREHGLVLYQAMATATRGWALVTRGQHDEGFEQLGEGLTDHRLTGAEVLLPHFLALLVDAFAKTGQD
jgi:hypothetical protein